MMRLTILFRMNIADYQITRRHEVDKHGWPFQVCDICQVKKEIVNCCYVYHCKECHAKAGCVEDEESWVQQQDENTEWGRIPPEHEDSDDDVPELVPCDCNRRKRQFDDI